MDIIDRVLQDAFAGNALLFVGAGASREATNTNGENLPTARSLANSMCTDLNLPQDKYPLSTVAQQYRKKKGAHKLLDYLKHELTVNRCPPKLNSLLQIPWRRIYTTNYDDLLEFCLPKSKSFNFTDTTRDVSKSSIVHFNGFINQANIHSLDNDLVLTDWSYAKSEIFQSTWLKLFQDDLYTSRSVLFVGYSMADLDITRTIVQDPDLIERCAIVVGEDTDEIECEELANYGTVYPKGMKFVYSRMKQASKRNETTKLPLPLDSLRRLGEANVGRSQKHRSELLFDQFVFGRLDEQQVLTKTTVNNGTVFERPGIQQAVDDTLSNGRKNIVLVGNIGTGKTVSTLLVARKLIAKGYSVFRVINKRQPNIEIENLLSQNTDSPIAIVFENYTRFRDEIEHFNRIARPGDIAILTERSPLHELFSDYVKHATSGNYLEVHLDRLSPVELSEFDDLLNYAGLWKEHAGKTKEQRLSLAREKFSSSLSSILLDVVRSEDIKERVNTEIEALLEDPPAYSLFTAALIITSLQYEFWVRDWQRLFAVSDVGRVLSSHGAAMKNFVNLDIASWSTNSSLLSAELLRNVIGNGKIVETLVDIYDRCCADGGYDEELSRLRVDLMRYNKLESVINENGKYAALKNYYLDIRSVSRTADNSDYWLQFGIMMSIHGNLLDEEEINQAELAFQNAYQREKTRHHPNTIRIDNYYSRFEIKKSTTMLDHTKAGEVFLRASQKLIRQIFDEEARHYPFKVGRDYTDVAIAHYEHWDQPMQARFIDRCKAIINLGEERLTKSNHKDVQFVVKDLIKLVDRLTSTDN